MNEPRPNFFLRIPIAFRIFFGVLFNAALAGRTERILRGEKPAPRPTAPSRPAPPVFREAPPDAALQLLGLLQQEGRLIDFLEEDVTAFSDSEVGAAARVVHEGCRKVLHDHFEIEPVRKEEEGSRIVLEEGFDASAIRLTGNVIGKAPFTGSLVHRGWMAERSKLPKVVEGHDTRILAPAEVEL